MSGFKCADLIFTGARVIMQQNYPDDFVLANGEQHTVKEFAEEAFRVAGINIKWKGSGVNEIGLSDDCKQ